MISATRILIADDHSLLRCGVRTTLEAHAGFLIVGEADNGRDAVSLCLSLEPDLAVLDADMPALSGIEATREIRAHCPRTRILILTGHNNGQLVHEALLAGAHGYLNKSDVGTDLVGAVEALARGRMLFSAAPDAVPHGNLADRHNGGTHAAPALTARERQVLQLLAMGQRTKHIAQKLCLSPHTVETHRRNIMHKMDFTSLSDVVRFAIKHNLITP